MECIGAKKSLSRRQHLRKNLCKRFLVMTESMKKSKKPILRTLFSEIQHWTTSKILMIQTDISDKNQIQIPDIEGFPYFYLAKDEEQRLKMISIS